MLPMTPFAAIRSIRSSPITWTCSSCQRSPRLTPCRGADRSAINTSPIDNPGRGRRATERATRGTAAAAIVTPLAARPRFGPAEHTVGSAVVVLLEFDHPGTALSDPAVAHDEHLCHGHAHLRARGLFRCTAEPRHDDVALLD